MTQEQAGLWKVSQGHLTGTGEDEDDKAARIRHLQTDPDVEYWLEYPCDMNDPQNNYATYVNLLDTDDCTLTQTDYVRFIVLDGSKFSFDNIAWTAHSSDDHDMNWAQFLHLDEESECIDRGHTPKDPGSHLPMAFRDFDDQAGPLEGPDPDTVVDRDIGADEYPTPDPDGFTFWWEKFAIETDE